MAIIEQKPWVNLFGKIGNISTFWTSCFFVLEYRKRHVAGLYCRKKKLEKWASFGPKPLINPFVKMVIIRPFELLVFIAQKGVFSFLNIIKHVFPSFFAEIKIWKSVNFDQTYGLTSLEKYQFLAFLTCCFYCLGSRFLFLDYRQAHFSFIFLIK